MPFVIEAWALSDGPVPVQVILKPAEATPLTALALAELGRRAGLPPGVLNIVVGEAKKIGRLVFSGPFSLENCPYDPLAVEHPPLCKMGVLRVTPPPLPSELGR